MRTPLLTLVAFAVLAGCSSPSPDPETSYKRFTTLASKHDWDGAFKLVVPKLYSTKKQETVDAVINTFEPIWDYEYKLVRPVAVTGDKAIIDVLETYDYKDPRSRKKKTWENQKQSYQLKKIDGLWYVVPPGMEKFSTFGF